jgi:hypothetical protein
MNKMKLLLAALALTVSGYAAAIDLKHGLSVTEAGVPMLEMGVTYTGLTKPEYAQLLTVENKFINAVEQVAANAARASKDKNRVAEYVVTLTGVVTMDDGKVTELAPVVIDKLTLKDINKIMRANQTYMSTLVNNSEMNAAKGKKAWGNK